jgi:hypothetical protein
MLGSFSQVLKAAGVDLESKIANQRVDATAARSVQDSARQILTSDKPDDRLLLHAYLVDLVINDIFEHIFGGTHYTPETEDLRLRTCKSLTVFLPALAASLESGREADALAAWRDYVKDYLTAINETNDLL